MRTFKEDEGVFEGRGGRFEERRGFLRRWLPFTERGGEEPAVEKKITEENKEEGGSGGFYS